MKEKIYFSELMIPPSITVNTSDLIEDVIHLFLKKRVKEIPVINDEGMFKGMISYTKLMTEIISGNSLIGNAESYIDYECYKIIGKDTFFYYGTKNHEVSLCICENGKLLGIVDKDAWINWYYWRNEVLKQFEDQCMEYELIFRNYYDSIYDIDKDGKIIFASFATNRIIGKPADQIIGRNIAELEDKKLYFPSVMTLVKQKRDTVTIVQNVENDKKAVVTGVPVFNDDGEIIRVIAATRDVSALVESIDHSLTQELEDIKMRLQDKEHLVDEYFLELRRLRKERKEGKKIDTQNREMQVVLELSKRIAPTDSNILILGESGTGKDLLANMIHNLSNRSKGPFIKINCGAIPETILESELFGYEAGAFTGAQKNGKAGLLELANGGTVFLNEIGEMPVNLQVKLLQAIQDRKFIRVGGCHEREVDIRIISATNKDLIKAIKEGEFREDLYYRLNVVPIQIPALKNRKEDIPKLALTFLQTFNQKYGRTKQISSAAMGILINYSWPGNVRELENLVERLVVVSERETILPIDFPVHMQKHERKNLRNVTFDESKTLKESIDSFEKEIIKQAYKKYKNTTKVAEVLEVNQSTIARKLKKYNIYDEMEIEK